MSSTDHGTVPSALKALLHTNYPEPMSVSAMPRLNPPLLLTHHHLPPTANPVKAAPYLVDFVGFGERLAYVQI